MIGLFVGLSYGVAQRTHEFGVRTALGATPRDIMGWSRNRGRDRVYVVLGSDEKIRWPA